MLSCKNFLLGIVWWVTLIRCQHDQGTVSQQQDVPHSAPNIAEKLDTIEKAIAQKTQRREETKNKLELINTKLQIKSQHNAYSAESSQNSITSMLTSETVNDGQHAPTRSKLADTSEETLSNGVGLHQEDAESLAALLAFPSATVLDKIVNNQVPTHHTTTMMLKEAPSDDSKTRMQAYGKKVGERLDRALAEIAAIDNNRMSTQHTTTAMLEEVPSDDMGPHAQASTTLGKEAQRLSALIKRLDQELNVLEEKRQQLLHRKTKN